MSPGVNGDARMKRSINKDSSDFLKGLLAKMQDEINAVVAGGEEE